MLELQRASAGSGKTFTLAKKFIWFFITLREEDGSRRLRRPAELADSLSHILAVTFTNKATNEMQQRIVEKLYALGYPGSEEGKRPDYMSDFLKELAAEGNPASEEELSEVCRQAVGILLNNYSDFHVSTIDSFFQQVLRTFAYESDLSDSYRIELDSDYLSVIAIDALLEDINSGRDSSGASFWIEEMMRRAKDDGKKWNIFAKSGSSYNPYSLLTESVKRLENEEFKKIRRRLDKYFSGETDLAAVYTDMRDKYELPVLGSHKNVVPAARRYLKVVEDNEDYIEPTDLKNFRKLGEVAVGSVPFKQPENSTKKPYYSLEMKPTRAYLDRKMKGNTEVYDFLEQELARLNEVYEPWVRTLDSQEFRLWKLYRENLPFMGMLQAIREKRDEYLRENNAIELGETNAMLHDIIGEEDTPFIYERIGTRLNHFLIDEFQDTSEMQWLNMSPLLHESVGKGNENLIIGDAKQSIYRFRNADSSLISSKVPDEFGGGREEAAAGSERNTNWRSDLRVVQFNNSFFDFLTATLNSRVGEEADGNRRNFQTDYRNVVQHPRHKEPEGYVEVHNKSQEGEDWNDNVLWSVVDIVEDALSRGFSLRDIAVLVDRNSEGEDVIATFMEHNAQIDDTENGKGHYRIDYVSEQSLRLVSSAAVAFLVSVLETISRGADPEVREGDERVRHGIADWADMACNYRFYALRNPGLSTPERLALFLKEGGDNNAISTMLAKMQSVTLPALVESIIAEFIPEDIRRSDAVFLSAFQDLVLEYCEGRPSDISSFLGWWEEKKKGASISSPEDMDAVTVMTVHKSKGLEFPVVIVPFANASFKDATDHPEWRWVEPVALSSEAGKLPDFLPVATDTLLEGTYHEPILYDFYDMKKMDALNSVYVAFTRAANELYIFSKPASKKNGEMELSTLLEGFFSSMIEGRPASVSPVELAEGSVFSPLGEIGFCYGTPHKSYKEKKNETSGDVKESVMEDYQVRPTPDFLLYRCEDVPEVKDADDPELADDPDPRSRGNVLHEIMRQVKTQSDIPRAVRRAEIKGLISYEEGAEIAAFLTVKTSRENVKGWFDGGVRVINERPLIQAGSITRRPDRIMIVPDGSAVVVDYKFGESTSSDRKYERQVADYVRTLMATGRFRKVTGYLWYVSQDRVEHVKV